MRLSRVKYSVVCDNDACFPSLLDLFSNEKISTGGALKTLARHHFRGWGVQVPVIATTGLLGLFIITKTAGEKSLGGRSRKQHYPVTVRDIIVL